MLEISGNRLGLQRSGIKLELLFWEKQASGLGMSSDQFQNRANPESGIKIYPAILDHYFTEFCQTNGHPPSVLDIGSGPISTLLHAHRHGMISLTATDTLADEYKSLLKDYGYWDAIRDIPFISAQSEALESVFSGKQFDITHCSNALDHTQSPGKSLEQICRLTGCDLYMIH